MSVWYPTLFQEVYNAQLGEQYVYVSPVYECEGRKQIDTTVRRTFIVPEDRWLDASAELLRLVVGSKTELALWSVSECWRYSWSYNGEL